MVAVAEGVVAAVAEGVVVAAAVGVVAAVAEAVGVVAAVGVGGHHQIGRTMIWDHFHRGTGIPRLPG